MAGGGIRKRGARITWIVAVGGLIQLALAVSTASLTTSSAAAVPNDIADYITNGELPAGVHAVRPRILMLGDSTLANMVWTPASQTTLTGLDYVLDAESCRTISVPSCRGRLNPITGEQIRPPNGLAVLDSYAPGVFDELVLMIGYNESSETFEKSLPLTLAMARAKGFKHVTWLTFHVDGYYQPPIDGDASYKSNNKILQVAVEAQRDGYLSLLDWDRYGDENPSFLFGDGAHITEDGAYAVGDFIHSAIDYLWDSSLSAPPAELARPQRSGAGGGLELAPSPVRLFDSRTLHGHVASQQAVRVTVPGGTDLASALVNLTADGAADAGFLTTYPCTDPVPVVSSLNVARLETRAAATIVPLDADGGFCIYSSVRTDVIVDLLGSFSPDSADQLTPRSPARVIDTRISKTRLVRNRPTRMAVPAAAANGIAVVLTAVDAVADGWIAITPTSPDGSCRTPNTSNLNFTEVAAIANSAFVAIDPANPAVCLYSSTAVHAIVDVMATTSSGTPLSKPDSWAVALPTRVVDTRRAGVRRKSLTVPLPAGTRAVTITATDSVAEGFVTAYSAAANGTCGTPPNSSVVNTRRDADVANLALVEPGRSLCLYASTATHLIVDRL
jgi:hypothetical protein